MQEVVCKANAAIASIKRKDFKKNKNLIYPLDICIFLIGISHV